jgi:hypothetical protein
MRQDEQSGDISSPLDDLTYDLVTVLHEKSKGLEAYEKYLQDAEGDDDVRELLMELQKQDIEAVRRLRECAARCLGGDETPGRQPTV